MNNYLKIISIAAFSLSVAIVSATSASAAYSINISGNGAGSINEVRVQSQQRMEVFQQNMANISNSVHAYSNTGGNKTNFNTGATTSINTGSSHTSVDISNHVNSNSASIGNCANCHGNGSGTGGNTTMYNYKKFHVWMNGGQEVPGPGDLNGWGHAKVVVNPDTAKLCVNMRVYGIEPATAAHLHQAPFGTKGPVVVGLPTPNAWGYSEGCVSLDHAKLTEIKNNPSSFYINIHNTPYPDGAVRGQLSH